jgi:hypothetical protein
MSKPAPQPHAAWLADFTPADGPLPGPQAAMLKKVQKQFPAARAGKRTSRNGVLHWFLIDPKLGPLAGPLQ